ncbi:MAG: hypothetical protein WAT79_05645 [Saprospiraceae bacterium]
MARKFKGWFFICLIFCPVALTQVYFLYQKSIIRKEVKKRISDGLSEEEKVKLTFLKNDISQLLKWEHDHEFEYNNQMFDVLHSEIKGDSIIYYCWWDHKESNLNQKLACLTIDALNQNKQQHQQKQHLKKFLNTLFCVNVTPIQFFINFREKLVIESRILWSSRWITPPLPPPKNILRITS